MPDLVLRTVTGTIKKADGSLWTGAKLRFVPFIVVNADGITVPVETVIVTTDDATAEFAADLYTLDESFLRYFVDLPSGEKYQFDLPDGDGEANLAELLVSAGLEPTDENASALQILMNNHAGVKASTVALGHVKIDGSSIVIDPNGVISAPVSASVALKANIESPDFTGIVFAPTLKLLDKTYNFAAAGWAGYSPLQVGNNLNPITGNASESVYGQKIDFYRSQNAGAFSQTSGLRVRANNAATGGSYITTAVEAFVTNAGATANIIGSMLQGVEGNVQAVNSIQRIVGGDFYAATSSGGSGTTVDEAVGVRAKVGSFNQFTILNVIIQEIIAALSNGPVTNLYGLRLAGWTGSAVQNSYGIYADATIDRGTASRFFIKSLSTSPSELAGTLSVPPDPYDSDTWDGNNQVPTKGDVRNVAENLAATIAGVAGSIPDPPSPYPQASTDIRKRYNSFIDCLRQTGLPDGGFLANNNAAGVFNLTTPNYANFADAVGVWVVSLRLAANTIGAIYEPDSFNGNSPGVGLLGRGMVKSRFRFGFLTLSDAVNTYTVRAGISNGGMVAPTNGCFFRYTHSVNGGKWEAVCMSGGVETAADTGVLAAVNGFHVFQVEVNAAGTSAGFYIDDVLVATIVSNIPTAASVSAAWHMLRSAGTATVDVLAIDYAWSEWNFNRL